MINLVFRDALNKYKIIGKEVSFGYFMHKLQKKCQIVEKITLETNNSFTLKLIGYLFYKLKSFAIKYRSINETFNFLEWTQTHFIIIKVNNKVSILDNRYIIDIKKVSNLTPDQIIVKDEIDDIFEEFSLI